MIVDKLEGLIGSTPLIQFYSQLVMNNNRIYLKLENRNLTGSVKDRAVLHMIKGYEEEGFLKNDTTIVEATSGNTGISLAVIGKGKGYEVIIVMPENMPKSRIKILERYGAKIELTNPLLGMKGAIDKAKELVEKNDNFVLLNQFSNVHNVLAHYTTGKEIDDDLAGNVDYVIAGIGSGGTITGISKYFLTNEKRVIVIGVEPENSSYLTKKKKGIHKIFGLGSGFKPDILDLSLVDEIKAVSDDLALKTTKMLGNNGILVGISSGAALAVALDISSKIKDKNIVVIIPDAGDRYFDMY